MKCVWHCSGTAVAVRVQLWLCQLRPIVTMPWPYSRHHTHSSSLRLHSPLAFAGVHTDGIEPRILAPTDSPMGSVGSHHCAAVPGGNTNGVCVGARAGVYARAHT